MSRCCFGYPPPRTFASVPNSPDDGGWVELDSAQLRYRKSSLSEFLVIKDGKVYAEYTKLSRDPHDVNSIEYVWHAYVTMMEKDYVIYLPNEFKVNENSNVLYLTGHMESIINAFSPSAAMIECMCPYQIDASGTERLCKELSVYESAESGAIGDNVLIYESEREMIKGVFDRARSRFGKTIDVFEVLSKLYDMSLINIYFEQRYVDIDKVAKQYGF